MTLNVSIKPRTSLDARVIHLSDVYMYRTGRQAAGIAGFITLESKHHTSKWYACALRPPKTTPRKPITAWGDGDAGGRSHTSNMRSPSSERTSPGPVEGTRTPLRDGQCIESVLVSTCGRVCMYVPASRWSVY